MTVPILEAMSSQGFEEVTALHDRASGLSALLAIHDTSAGPAFGGIRRVTYRGEKEALLDCLRLALAMSHKCALAEIEGGGAKMVVLDSGGLDAPGAYRAIGRHIHAMGGRYYAGPDVGTTDADLECVAEGTSNVTRPGAAGPGDLDGATCAGVLAGLEAALVHLDGEADWPRRRVVVQGLGRVGAGLARLLAERGAHVLASEIDAERARRVGGELELEAVEPGQEFDVECDAFAPCALGGILHDLTIQRLRARVVAGGANNVLAKSRHAQRLHERGVLCVPDVVINSGAVIRGATFHLSGTPADNDEIGARIGRATGEVLARAEGDDLPPSVVAVREAERRIAARRERRDSTPIATGAPEGDSPAPTP